MARKVLKFKLGASVDFFFADEDDEVQPVAPWDRRTVGVPVVRTMLIGDEVRRFQQATRARAAAVKAYFSTPRTFEWTLDPRNPERLKKVPIRPLPLAPQHLEALFPSPPPPEPRDVVTFVPPPANTSSQLSIFRGTATLPDGRVVGLFEPLKRPAAPGRFVEFVEEVFEEL